MVRGVPAGGSPYLVSRPPTESRALVVQTTGFRELARTEAFHLPSTQTSLRNNFRNGSVYKDETGPRFCVWHWVAWMRIVFCELVLVLTLC